MNRERFPTTRAGEQSSAQICMRLTRSQLAELDRFCAERKLTRSQVARRAWKDYLIQRAIGQEE